MGTLLLERPSLSPACPVVVACEAWAGPGSFLTPSLARCANDTGLSRSLKHTWQLGPVDGAQTRPWTVGPVPRKGVGLPHRAVSVQVTVPSDAARTRPLRPAPRREVTRTAQAGIRAAQPHPAGHGAHSPPPREQPARGLCCAAASRRRWPVSPRRPHTRAARPPPQTRTGATVQPAPRPAAQTVLVWPSVQQRARWPCRVERPLRDQVALPGEPPLLQARQAQSPVSAHGPVTPQDAAGPVSLLLSSLGWRGDGLRGTGSGRRPNSSAPE